MFQPWTNTNQVQQLKHKAHKTLARLNDRHIKLAVTGLSGSGKTAFIVSLVNQILNAKVSSNLPFFSVLHESRLIGVKRTQQPDLKLARFNYEAGMHNLSATPANWPDSTRGMSQVRLQLKFKKHSSIGRLLSEDATLLLDITDYPGEWLLDLPLLGLDFKQWSEQCYLQLQDPLRQQLAADFKQKYQQLTLTADADELLLQQIAESYSKYLLECKASGYEVLQPGRFILPGELEGAPILHFVPLVLAEQQNIDWDNIPKGSNLELMQQRFEQYKQQIVTPFYKQHFRHFDRQVVLVDCLGALNQGQHRLAELQSAIGSILGSFNYGKNNLLKRLFNPKIDKLMFVASKADRITSCQQQNLGKLLAKLIQQARAEIEFEGTDVESTSVAAIKASVEGKVIHQGEEITVLKGRNTNGDAVILYPGDVPDFMPGNTFWQQQQFAFPEFSPPEVDMYKTLPHIRMDTILEYLLGDKLQ